MNLNICHCCHRLRIIWMHWMFYFRCKRSAWYVASEYIEHIRREAEECGFNLDGVLIRGNLLNPQDDLDLQQQNSRHFFFMLTLLVRTRIRIGGIWCELVHWQVDYSLKIKRRWYGWILGGYRVFYSSLMHLAMALRGLGKEMLPGLSNKNSALSDR